MKRIIHSTIIFLLGYFIFVSCDEKDSLTPNTISIEKDSITLSSLEQSFKIKVKSQTDFSAISDCDWISVLKYYSELGSFIEIHVQENQDTLISRSGIITISTEKNDASTTLHVIQTYKSIIRLFTTYQELTSAHHDLFVPLKSNCDFEILIPEEASDWITVVGTKAVNESRINLSISRNLSYNRRTASIIFNNKSDGVQDTLKITQDEGFQSLRILLRDNPHTTVFYNALVATCLSDTLMKYIDETYPTPGYDSTFACLEYTGRVAVEYSTGNENDYVVWPQERYFKYTLFAVTDSILANYHDKYCIQTGLDEGIQSYADLVKYAEAVYPEGKGKEATDTESSIYKLISYHILPCFLPRNLMNFTNPDIIKDYSDYAKFCDMEDFYETMHPYAIMRISTPYDPKVNGGNGTNIYINRKGTLSQGNLDYPGVLIWSANATKEINTVGALNGGYYFVDSLLLFDNHTKNALNTRMRIMANTLSPDFINSNARGRMTINDRGRGINFAVYSFKDGFCKNFKVNNDQSLMVVRYQRNYWDVYYHDEMTILGNFDITLRLPPVPRSDTYEIRIFGNAQAGEAARKKMGIVQFYFGDENENFTPCSDPVDMAPPLEDPMIGYVKDEDLTKNITDEDEKEKAIIANDKAMRNRGYMKAPGNFKTSGTNLRDNRNAFRKILCEQYMEAGKDYYLRLKNVSDEDKMIRFSFIEIVPFSIYSGIYGLEDKY